MYKTFCALVIVGFSLNVATALAQVSKWADAPVISTPTPVVGADCPCGCGKKKPS